MTKHMLIDATHQEETRVVVVDGQRLEEFDVETAQKKPLKGNIYLAKVVRVEPSLQAAFVDYGGNRHGFLAFNEIHPDYYRIPIADREALIAEEAEVLREQADAEEAENGSNIGSSVISTQSDRLDDRQDRHEEDRGSDSREDEDGDGGHRGDDENDLDETGEDARGDTEGLGETDEEYDAEEDGGEEVRNGSDSIAHGQDDADDAGIGDGGAIPSGLQPDTDSSEYDTESEPAQFDNGTSESELGESLAGEPALLLRRDNDDPILAKAIDSLSDDAQPIESESRADAGGDKGPPARIEILGGDEIDEAKQHRRVLHRRYKIQEVIKRRQIMLVQVTKEERGTKGAALTTYLSLAGRYCVLMPNTGQGGGISRKISSPADRKRLKSVLDELGIPDGMSVIVRTAGSERTKAEIRRDCDYLLRLWDGIRDQTLKSTAPALIHEEANLIKRSIRDLYSRDIEDVIVEGDEGYKAAKSFMRMLMPSHAKRVQQYKDPKIPLFQRFHVESQLYAIHSPVVQLKSGGYIVLNQTEALVSIDVNSGRATRERHIEETALKTNLEAAAEIARQLRLRDLAGLIVIDFIDMEEQRHNNAVERKLKEAMRQDRARIQIGRISPFGLLELSRQRLRPSLVEASTEICRHCRGIGHVRSTESTALHILRSLEDEAIRKPAAGFSVRTPTAVALYILNQKRRALAELEIRHGVRVYVNGDDALIPPDFELERLKELPPGELPLPAPAAVDIAIAAEPEEEMESETDEDADEESTEETTAGINERSELDRSRRRRGRRGRRGDSDREERSARSARGERGAQPVAPVPHAVDQVSGTEPEAAPPPAQSANGTVGDPDDKPRRRRRRGRRGGRRRRRGPGEEAPSEEATPASDTPPRPIVPSPADFRFVGEVDIGSTSADGDDEEADARAAALAASTGEIENGPYDDDEVDAESVPQEDATGNDDNLDNGGTEDGPDVAADVDVAPDTAPAAERAAEPEPAEKKPAGPRRGGWWQRRDLVS
jgi:ribonuclease E